MGKPKFPMIVKRGHTIVKVYKTPSNKCDQFTVVHYLGNQRQRKTFSDVGLAITEAETVAARLSQGDLNALKLTGKDQVVYVRTVEILKPLGIPIEVAAMYVAEMYKILNGRNPIEAAHYFAKHHPVSLPNRTVPQVVDELLAAKEADKLSDVYLKALRVRLGRFKETFTGQISLVSTSEIERFLRELTVVEKLPTGETRKRPASPKSRNHFRAAIGLLFYFAESSGYIAKGGIDLDAIAVAKQKPSEIEIYTPEELKRILAAADETMIPFLTIAAFAGVRHAEIQRLDWAEVRLNHGFIEVKASKAKTASRRLVPITKNLKAWLTPHKKACGPVCEYVTPFHQLDSLTVAVNRVWSKENEPGKFEWKHNALRHSFISYRVADIQNVAQVALEAGNSPRMVFSNYRELVRPADAKKWFAITPASVAAAKAEREKHSKIIALPKAAAA